MFYYIGDTVHIEWTHDGTDTDVSILLMDGDSWVMGISDATPVADGYFQWTIPDDAPTGDNFRIRMHYLVDDAMMAESGTFSINDPSGSETSSEPGDGDGDGDDDDGGIIPFDAWAFMGSLVLVASAANVVLRRKRYE